MKTDNDSDSTFRSGAAFAVTGFLIIAAIWYVFLRPTEETYEPPATIPITTADPNDTIYELVPGESGIQFTIDEILRGQPKKVVGVTGFVSGQIALNLVDLSTAQIGVVQINARSFYTDDIFRDESLHTFIIESQTYPVMIFTPVNISGLPAQAAVGETAVFTITGDLTIRDVTRSVTFDCTAVPTSPNKLEGSATATINRADFDLTIPQVPQVANVAEEIAIAIDFAATAVTENQ